MNRLCARHTVFQVARNNPNYHTLPGGQPGGRRVVRQRPRVVAAVRQAFLGQSCVRSAFGPADARQAAYWHAARVPLETARQAILLGCTRTSLMRLGRPGRQPVRGLRYFEPPLRDVARERFPEGYWRHLAFHPDRCEDYWRRAAGLRSRRCPTEFGTSNSGSGSPASRPRRGQR